MTTFFRQKELRATTCTWNRFGGARREADVHSRLHADLVRDVAAGDGAEGAVGQDAGFRRPAAAFLGEHLELVAELQRGRGRTA